MVQRPERIHSRFLFPAIVFLLVAQPVAASLSATGSGVLAIPFALSLVAGIWSLERGGPWVAVGAALGLAAVLAAGAANLCDARGALPAVAGLLVLLGALFTVLGVRWLFSSPSVSVESLLAAMSVYLLIAIVFGILHVALYALDPTWYHGVSPSGTSAETAELVYFSIGTLTGTAYGEIVPAHPLTRLLSNVEAVVGQMYVAVLVAMLVSGYAAGRGGARDAPRT